MIVFFVRMNHNKGLNSKLESSPNNVFISVRQDVKTSAFYFTTNFLPFITYTPLNSFVVSFPTLRPSILYMTLSTERF